MIKKSLVFIILLVLGVTVRVIFVHDVIQSPFLNVLLPGTDEFNYAAIANDKLSPDPLDLKMTVYPAYLYFVKGIFSFFGNDGTTVYWFQIILSLLSVVLLFLTGNALFGFTPGIVCSFLYLFYKTNFVYDVILIPTAVSQFLIIAMLFFFVINRKYSSAGAYIGFTVSGLFTCFFRPFFWFLFLPAVIYFFITEKHWKYLKHLTINILIGLLSIFLFNTFHTPESFLHKFGIMFYISNHDRANGLLMPLPDIPMTAEAHCKNSIKIAYRGTNDKSKVNTFWIRKTFESIKLHPFTFIKLFLKKINYIVNNYEIHNNENVYFFEQNSILNKLPKINFACLFSLSMLGIVLSLIYRKNKILLLSLIYLTLMIFTMPLCSRYRMPVIPFLCLFAGFGVDYLFSELKNKRYRLLLIGTSVIICSLSWSNLKFSDLDKETDLKFWEKNKERRIEYKKSVDQSLSEFAMIKSLPIEKSINLALSLGRLQCFKEFFSACDIVLPLVEREEQKIRLLKQKAIIYETMFNFDKATQIWEQLKSFKPIKNLAENKIQELKIYASFIK